LLKSVGFVWKDDILAMIAREARGGTDRTCRQRL